MELYLAEVQALWSYIWQKYKRLWSYIWQKYKRLWSYIWQKWVDHRYEAWYGFNLTRKSELVNDRKAIAGPRCDYQSMQACITTLTVFE